MERDGQNAQAMAGTLLEEGYMITGDHQYFDETKLGQIQADQSPPPHGVMPYGTWLELRIADLADAISRRVKEVGIDRNVTRWAEELALHAFAKKPVEKHI